MSEPDPLEADMMRGAALAVHRRADRQAHFLEVKTPTGRCPTISERLWAPSGVSARPS
jgi:hypothetical protein